MGKPKDVVNFRIRVKTALVSAFDGKCQLCGKEYPQSVFEFHHLNPQEKSFGLSMSNTTRAKADYAREARKCIMLCANCHRLVEYENVDISQLKCIFNEEKYYQTLEKLTKKVKKVEEKKEDFRIKPTKEQLVEDLTLFKGNFTAIGKKYGYTDNAVRKWCKKFGLPFHSADYK